MKNSMWKKFLILVLGFSIAAAPLLTGCAESINAHASSVSQESDGSSDTSDEPDNKASGEQIDLFGDNQYGYGVGIPELAEKNKMLVGSTWPDQMSKEIVSYCGYLEKQMECEVDSVRELVTTTLSDGSEGKAIRIANDGTKNYAGAANLITGFTALSPGKTYTMYATIKYTAAPEDAINGHLRQVYLSTNQDKDGLRVIIEPDTGWQTYTYRFTTPDTLEDSTYFCVGADSSSPFLYAGFEILIERIQLIGDAPEDSTMNQTVLADIKEVDYSGFGLQIDEDGTIMLNGKPFYGMGVNFHGPVSMRMGDPNCDLDIYFAKLEEAGIPYCRIMFGIFYDFEVSTYLAEQSHDKLLAAMDYVVGLAEQHNIGIIASLFWNASAFVSYFGETLDELADPESEGIKLQKQYIHEIVGRYKYSPAIWAWEIGNEGNLAVDLQECAYIGNDGKKKVFKTETLTAYYEIIGAAIREEDPYRMITGGDSAPRGSSAALHKTEGGSWSPTNTYDDYKQALAWYTPSPLDTVSLHYPELSLIGDYVQMAKELKIGLFIGEFHADPSKLFLNPLDALSPEESPEEAAEQKSWFEMRDAFMENGVQLATAWCYGRYAQQHEDNTSIEAGMVEGVYQNFYQYEGLKEANAIYVSEGKTDASNYWKSVTMAIHS